MSPIDPFSLEELRAFVAAQCPSANLQDRERTALALRLLLFGRPPAPPPPAARAPRRQYTIKEKPAAERLRLKK